MTYQEIKQNEEVLAYIRKGNAALGVLGYTDHSEAHTALVAERAAFILDKFSYSEHDKELVKIAGFMQEIGNVINRKNHAEYGGILANDILRNTDMSLEDRVKVISAISNFDDCSSNSVCTLTSTSEHAPFTSLIDVAKDVIYLITAGIICLLAISIMALDSILITLAYVS